MSRAAPARLQVLLLLLLMVILDGTEAKYATRARRAAHRLNSTSLEQHKVSSAQQCLALCEHSADCVAFNLHSVSDTANCQLLGQRACDGLQLVADVAFDYYDVYSEPQNLTAERQTPFWDDPGCVQDGYCATDCSAEAAGDFCTVDAHCSANLKPPGGYRCLESECQPSADFWELRAGLALPRWQLWRADRIVWTWKKLKPDTCSLDVNVKLGIGALMHISVAIDDLTSTQIHFRFTTTDTDIVFFDSGVVEHNLILDADTTGMVSADAYSRLKVSWRGGNLAIGPEANPTQVTATASLTQPMGYVMVHSVHANSWMTVDSGVADRWLFEDAGVVEDAVINVAFESYAFRHINATNDVTVKYDCKAPFDCNVYLSRGDSSVVLSICVGCRQNTQSILTYHGDFYQEAHVVNTGPVLSDTEFNTFTVRYNNGAVTIHRNEAATPIYQAVAPHLIPDITLIGIGGCCSRKTLRVARYDPGWRTDTWLTEGRGYSNGDEPEPE